MSYWYNPKTKVSSWEKPAVAKKTNVSKWQKVSCTCGIRSEPMRSVGRTFVPFGRRRALCHMHAFVPCSRIQSKPGRHNAVAIGDG